MLWLTWWCPWRLSLGGAREAEVVVMAMVETVVCRSPNRPCSPESITCYHENIIYSCSQYENVCTCLNTQGHFRLARYLKLPHWWWKTTVLIGFKYCAFIYISCASCDIPSHTLVGWVWVCGNWVLGFRSSVRLKFSGSNTFWIRNNYFQSIQSHGDRQHVSIEVSR